MYLGQLKLVRVHKNGQNETGGYPFSGIKRILLELPALVIAAASFFMLVGRMTGEALCPWHKKDIAESTATLCFFIKWQCPTN
jgi:hypothetical protein